MCGASACLAFVVLAGCGPQPDGVVVRHSLGEDIVVDEVSFGGCRWDDALLHGQSTTICDPYEFGGPVTFRKIEELEKLDGAGTEMVAVPYRSSTFDGDSDARILELQLTPDIVQPDYSAPDPVGH
jgi:hypothetical protein